MRLDDSSPNHSEFCVVSDGLCLEDVGDSLAEVIVCVFLVVDTFDIEQSELFMLSCLSSF